MIICDDSLSVWYQMGILGYLSSACCRVCVGVMSPGFVHFMR